ncbi:MAG: hypothetical protein A4E32_02069 [Methanomassiliicoccales archaeon PtaU1.Bin124]|nr:MAG: hypothetical protein A4E32_02069 [Methanomassiliicoccales archaeon PtaU1.Bin124]
MMAEDFSAYAAKVHVEFVSIHDEKGVQSMVEALMSRIALDCVDQGTRLIGHVKCIAEIEKEKYLACSVVGHDGKARCSGGLGRSTDRLEMVINVLQYGLTTMTLEKIVKDRAPKAFGADAKVVVETIGKDESCERPRPIQLV